jgi:hypothetical protein
MGVGGQFCALHLVNITPRAEHDFASLYQEINAGGKNESCWCQVDCERNNCWALRWPIRWRTFQRARH